MSHLMLHKLSYHITKPYNLAGVPVSYMQSVISLNILHSIWLACVAISTSHGGDSGEDQQTASAQWMPSEWTDNSTTRSFDWEEREWAWRGSVKRNTLKRKIICQCWVRSGNMYFPIRMTTGKARPFPSGFNLLNFLLASVSPPGLQGQQCPL